MTKLKTIGVLTGGGDCPGLNAVIRAVARTADSYGLKTWGIRNGFGGLVENNMFELTSRDVSGILQRGGTILGTTNRDNPFNYRAIRGDQIIYEDKSVQALANLRSRGIEALVVIGGDGSLRIGAEFANLGVKVVAVPKTIDNDIPSTERTFGFDTAVTVATEALDRLHTTAESHHRVMVLEVMGRYAGWIALHAGLAGGADCILIPEIPYCLETIVAKIKDRQSNGKNFSIIVVAEGAKPVDGEMTVARLVECSPEKVRLGGVGDKLTRQIEDATGAESRCTVLGHLQRGGTPTAYDRILATRYGVAAVDCLVAGQSGIMVALQHNRIIPVLMEDVAGRAGTVPLDNEFIRVGQAIGVSFGA